MRQYHVQLEAGDIGEYVLLPGDPGRSELIAARFDNAHHVRSNREYTTWTGTLDGVKVSVCSTGIGGPSTAIAMEELCNIGAKTLIRVGTCGGIGKHVKNGDLVVMNAAVRMDGTSRQYAPIEFPAVADLQVTNALHEAALETGCTTHVGITVSNDAFYCEMESERMPRQTELENQLQSWIRAGVAGIEMECATLYIAAQVRGVRAGGVCVAVDNAGEMPVHGAVKLDNMIDTGVGAIRRLIAMDGAAAGRNGATAAV